MIQTTCQVHTQTSKEANPAKLNRINDTHGEEIRRENPLFLSKFKWEWSPDARNDSLTQHGWNSVCVKRDKQRVSHHERLLACALWSPEVLSDPSFGKSVVAGMKWHSDRRLTLQPPPPPRHLITWHRWRRVCVERNVMNWTWRINLQRVARGSFISLPLSLSLFFSHLLSVGFSYSRFNSFLLVFGVRSFQLCEDTWSP